jgi:hypothetical protein
MTTFMLLTVVLPGGLLIALALFFRQPVGVTRTLESLVPALLALAIPLLVTQRSYPSAEAATWAPLLALVMAPVFWVLAALSLSGRQWPRESPSSIAASVTVWPLAILFGAYHFSVVLGFITFADSVLFECLFWPLVVTAATFFSYRAYRRHTLPVA